MGQTGYLILSIVLIVALAAIFVTTFVLNKRMKVKEGYALHKPSEEKCGGCSELGCPFFEKYHKEDD